MALKIGIAGLQEGTLAISVIALPAVHLSLYTIDYEYERASVTVFISTSQDFHSLLPWYLHMTF